MCHEVSSFSLEVTILGQRATYCTTPIHTYAYTSLLLEHTQLTRDHTAVQVIIVTQPYHNTLWG